MATRCCWPPDSCAGIELSLSESPTFCRLSRATRSASSLPRLRTLRCATVRLSSTDRCANRLKDWKTIPMPRRAASMSTSSWVISLPLTTILPAFGSSSRFTHRNRVDLPEPDGPMMQITCPRLTSTSMPLSTSNSPKALCRPETSTITSVSAVIPNLQPAPILFSQPLLDERQRDRDDQIAETGHDDRGQPLGLQ